MMDLIEKLLAGNRRALGKVLTLVENESEGASQALADLFPYTGYAAIVGITGAPGTGKSSLVNALTQSYRQKDKTVAIVAVDPTSPFSGGAILGDRIRMRDISGDPGVFIRSMATRGSLGGLAKTTRDIIRVFDAAHFDVVLVETVGAGQSEVDIVRTAQTTIVVDAPGMGDDVQAIKAGILEIADILVVNKADRPDARNTVRALKAMLELGHPAAKTGMSRHHGRYMPNEPDKELSFEVSTWLPVIVETVATENEGIEALQNTISNHQTYLQTEQSFDRIERERLRIELFDRLQTEMMRRLYQQLDQNQLDRIISQIQQRDLDPGSAVNTILRDFAV